MGNKAALSFAKINSGSTVASPFWAKPKSKRSNFKKAWKSVWKWSKLLVFAFFMLMGLWGCFQTMWDPTIAINREIGSGMEFGFDFGTTGDWRYDLSASAMGQYHTFTDWSLAYGPFYAFFVWPGALLVINLMYTMKDFVGATNALISIFILLLIIRVLTLLVTLRSSLQNEKMSEVQGKISEINAKYKDLKDQASRQKKQQEVMAIYSKNNVKPFAAFEQMFITLPIFLIVYRVVTIARPLKASVLFGIWNFAATPLSELFSNFTNMGWVYIFFLLLVIPMQFMSMKLPQMWARKRNRKASATSGAGNKQMKKMKMTQNIFAAVMSVVVAFSAVGVGVYWFLNALFSILQAYIIHRVIIRSRKKHNNLESKLEKLILE